MKNDTICAISTPLGRSGIGIVRLSGPKTYPFLEKLFRDKKGRPVKLSRLPSHTVRYGFIREGGRVRDEVLLTVMKSPRSYTREDMAEIGCHGGLVPLKGVLKALISTGCRLAEPGEVVVPGSTLAIIADLKTVKITAFISERDLGFVSLGMSARLRADSHPEKSFAATVSRIADEAEFTPKTIQTREERVKTVYRIELTAINSGGIFKPGMPVDVVLTRPSGNPAAR